jgi:hypothetical protein
MLDDRLTALENSVRVHSERFKHIKQVLQHIPNLLKPQQNAPCLEILEGKITHLETQLTQVLARPPGHVTSTSGTLEESISTIQEEIRLLKQ